MSEKPGILIINGPNLNLLGVRERGIYGKDSLDDINKRLETEATDLGLKAIFFQSNSEGDIVDRIQAAMSEGIKCLIINAGAYTHTSVAIRDAIAGVDVPAIEVHLSNIFTREEFRHNSFISPVSIGIISGFGSVSYILALRAASELIKNQ